MRKGARQPQGVAPGGQTLFGPDVIRLQSRCSGASGEVKQTGMGGMGVPSWRRLVIITVRIYIKKKMLFG
jgi:hypothetical protein